MNVERTIQFMAEQMAALSAREGKWRDEEEGRSKRMDERSRRMEDR
jgi:hypothetical protein